MRNPSRIGFDEDLIGFTEASNSLASFPLSLGERVASATPREPGEGHVSTPLPDPTALLSAIMNLGNAAIHLQASQLLEADPTAEIYITGADGQTYPLG